MTRDFNLHIPGFVIERTDGRWLAKSPIFGSTYTRHLKEARKFMTQEAALVQCCENERPRALADLVE